MDIYTAKEYQLSKYSYEVIFSNGEVMVFDIVDSPIAMGWLKLFRQCLSGNLQDFSRLHGVLDGPRQWPFLFERLKGIVERINQYGVYPIEESPKPPYSQEMANIFHHHFSVLSGAYMEESDFFKEAPSSVKSAVCSLNAIIHEMEDFERALKINREAPARTPMVLIHDFFCAPRFKIPAAMEKHFDLNYSFGDVVLNYSQVGKTWLDLYFDDDEHVVDEVILPLAYLSGSSITLFGDSDPWTGERRQKMEKILADRGGQVSSEGLNLGFLKVAQLRDASRYQSGLLQRILALQVGSTGLRLLHEGSLLVELKPRPDCPEEYDWDRATL